MNKIKVLSLFDGISCGRVALERVGIKVDTYYASEIDEKAIDISRYNYPDIIQMGNVLNLDTVLLSDIDLLIGGSPCQSFTFAGKQDGMTTTEDIDITTLEQYLDLKSKGFVFKGQSYLFWEYVRVLKETNPKYFFLENVKMKKKWETIITKTLRVEPIKFNSNLVSAQNRNRLYWTNIPLSGFPTDKGILLKDIIREEDNSKYHLSKKHYDAFLKSYNWKHSPLEGKAKPLLASYYKQPPHCPYIQCELSESGYRMLSPIETERCQTLRDDYTKYGKKENGKIYEISKCRRYQVVGNGWTIDAIVEFFKRLHNTY